MMKATIKVEFTPGCLIEDAFREAIRLASVLNANIEFQFNSVKCVAFPYGDTEIGVKEYHAAFKKDGVFRFAFASRKEATNG